MISEPHSPFARHTTVSTSSSSDRPPRSLLNSTVSDSERGSWSSSASLMGWSRHETHHGIHDLFVEQGVSIGQVTL